MAYLSVPNVRISGISAAVPQAIENVCDLPLLTESDSTSFSKTTGVYSRRVASKDTCSSDLCYQSAKKLIDDLGWSVDDIDCLVFVTQTPDFQIPSTSPILQDRLGLSTNCLTLDISLGCSGWVYALSVISSMMSRGDMRKGLLLSGDTILKTCSKEDKSSYPLFGDAGSATALEYVEGDKGFRFNLKVDGSGSSVIRIPDGGFRNVVNSQSFITSTIDEKSGIKRNSLNLILEGMDVFTFGISKAPECILELANHYSLDLEKVDYFTFHQANMFMNEKIRKKLKIAIEKVPSSLSSFGNTSCASIPLTMVTELGTMLENSTLNHIACGFGVGLSWGSVNFETNHIVLSELIEV